MRQLISLLIFLFSISIVYGQTDTIVNIKWKQEQDSLKNIILKQDTLKEEKYTSNCSDFPKPDKYRTFKKENCDDLFHNSCGGKKANELLCEAKCHISKKGYYIAIPILYCAYMEAQCFELKFRIVKTVQQVYVLLGDTKEANAWQMRVDKILEQNPDIDK